MMMLSWTIHSCMCNLTWVSVLRISAAFPFSSPAVVLWENPRSSSGLVLALPAWLCCGTMQFIQHNTSSSRHWCECHDSTSSEHDCDNTVLSAILTNTTFISLTYLTTFHSTGKSLCKQWNLSLLWRCSLYYHLTEEVDHLTASGFYPLGLVSSWFYLLALLDCSAFTCIIFRYACIFVCSTLPLDV